MLEYTTDEYIVPSFHNDENKDYLWIVFEALEFLGQSAYTRGDSYIKVGSTIARWKLLAPMDILEECAHDWGEYESTAQRISGVVGTYAKVGSEVEAFKNALETGTKDALAKLGVNEGMSSKDILNKIAGSSSAVDIPKYKIDNALTYQDTKRRSYSMTFNFAPYKSNFKSEVFEPVRRLQELSCPELDKGFVNIKWPAIFRVFTMPGDLIRVDTAALTAVQPSWRGPYKNGYPIHCELQLSFTDLQPLYRKSFTEGGIIEVVEEINQT